MAQKLSKTQVVRFALGYDDLVTLDPHMTNLLSDLPILNQIYEGLVGIAHTADVVSDEYSPSLAERWESSTDKKTWTFHLRKGVEWHNGHGEFSSEDVKFSFERVGGKDLGSPFRGSVGNIDRVETDGPNLVKISLKSPDPYFLKIAFNYQCGHIVCKRAIAAGVNMKIQPVGTGPFQMGSYQSREKVTLLRNDKHWAGKPTIEQIVFYFMSQLSTRELALRSGDVDGIDLEYRQDVIDRVRRQKGVVDIATSGLPYMLFINLTKKPFDDLRVRQALAHATDRARITTFVGAELFTAEHSSVPAGYVGHIDDVRRYEFDLKKAKALLKEAGFPDGLTTEVIISNSALYLPLMQLLQEQYKQAGIILNLKVVDHPTFHRLIRQDASPLVLYNADRYPKIASVYFDQFYAGPAAIGKPTAITNFSHYGEAISGIDDLLQKAKTATDAEESKRLWAEAQKKVSEDLPSVPLYNQRVAIARSPHLELGYKFANLPFYHFAKARLLDV